MRTGLILSMFDLLNSEGKKALYAAVGKFYEASRSRSWFLMQGEIVCCTGDNCNTEAPPSLPPAGKKNIAISYETNTLDCTYK